mmetsp:Transcript_3169/g.8757  ORF Transcript_3169/g.8757 Transcript_3169/m.8757 type:complete len:180 (+) Transcript_3169:188-727(+)
MAQTRKPTRAATAPSLLVLSGATQRNSGVSNRTHRRIEGSKGPRIDIHPPLVVEQEVMPNQGGPLIVRDSGVQSQKEHQYHRTTIHQRTNTAHHHRRRRRRELSELTKTKAPPSSHRIAPHTHSSARKHHHHRIHVHAHDHRMTTNEQNRQELYSTTRHGTARTSTMILDQRDTQNFEN